MAVGQNRFELYKDNSHEWRWRYVASNGKIVADSAEGYKNKEDAEQGILIMKGSASVTVVEVGA